MKELSGNTSSMNGFWASASVGPDAPHTAYSAAKLEWAFPHLLTPLGTEGVKSSLMLLVMQASNSYRGFESLSVRQQVCKPFLRGLYPEEKELLGFNG
jgi:hypothetical protein